MSGDSGSDRVIRGGGWGGCRKSCRSAERSYRWSGISSGGLGFRLVRERIEPKRVLRGGSYINIAKGCYSAYRHGNQPNSRYAIIGARFVRERIDPPKAKRKIVQIAGSDNRLYALCDDGTVWEMNHDGEWTKHQGIPQADE